MSGLKSAQLHSPIFLSWIILLIQAIFRLKKLLILAALVCMSRNYLTRRFRGWRIRKKENLVADLYEDTDMNWTIKTFDQLTGKEIYEILRSRAEVFAMEDAKSLHI